VDVAAFVDTANGFAIAPFCMASQPCHT